MVHLRSQQSRRRRGACRSIRPPHRIYVVVERIVAVPQVYQEAGQCMVDLTAVDDGATGTRDPAVSSPLQQGLAAAIPGFVASWVQWPCVEVEG